jgi:hypothetical protein
MDDCRLHLGLSHVALSERGGLVIGLLIVVILVVVLVVVLVRVL